VWRRSPRRLNGNRASGTHLLQKTQRVGHPEAPSNLWVRPPRLGRYFKNKNQLMVIRTCCRMSREESPTMIW
jgi:hypothetical protein